MTYVSIVIVKIIFVKEAKCNHFNNSKSLYTLREVKVKLGENTNGIMGGLWLWIMMIIGSG